MWTRMRGRLAGMFTRRNSEGDRTTHGDGVGTAEDPVVSPDDFRFPWTRPVEPPFESVDAALPADAAKAGGGFLSRILGKSPPSHNRGRKNPRFIRTASTQRQKRSTTSGGATFAKPMSEAAPDARDSLRSTRLSAHRPVRAAGAARPRG